jgi:uncharacterized protein (DUF2249 family)
MQRDCFRCQYCGRSSHDGATLHVDHVTPKIDGGSDDDGNLLTACSDCNLGKSATHVVPDEDPSVRTNEQLSDEKTETFGLSYNSDGYIQWQFLVKSSDNHAATLQLFSWMDGRPTDTVTKPWSWIKENCSLFQDEAEWRAHAEEDSYKQIDDMRRGRHPRLNADGSRLSR